MLTLKMLKSQVIVIFLYQYNFQLDQMWSKKERERRMTKLLSGIHRKNLSFTQEKVMSWLKVDQEPDLGHIKLVLLMNNQMEMIGK